MANKGAGALFALLGALGLLAVASHGANASETPSEGANGNDNPLPPEVNDAISDYQNGNATPGQLRNAAESAAQAGYNSISDALHRAADAVQAISEQENRVTPSKVTSPIKGVSDEQWSSFVKAQKTGKSNGVTPGGLLGVFEMGPRTLGDLGYMNNVHKEGRKWLGTFISPLTEEQFLGDEKLQYEAFSRQILNHLQVIRKRYPSILETEIEGKKATMSGLLAVARFAGLGGLDAWIRYPAKRKPETTKTYLRNTGIF